MITLILAILLIAVILRAVILEGDVIYRITSTYPNYYKNYVWAFGQRLKIIFLSRQIKKGIITDEILIEYYKKLVKIHLFAILIIFLLIASLKIK
jgi:hypothetical protein